MDSQITINISVSPDGVALAEAGLAAANDGLPMPDLAETAVIALNDNDLPEPAQLGTLADAANDEGLPEPLLEELTSLRNGHLAATPMPGDTPGAPVSNDDLPMPLPPEELDA